MKKKPYQESNRCEVSNIQDSLLRQFDRLSFGQDPLIFSCDSLYYSEIPKQVPESIRSDFTHCLFLQNYTFFQMFTFIIFQFLLHRPNQKKEKLLQKLRRNICSEFFLTGSNYTKGLLIQGIKEMISKREETEYKKSPIAQQLMKSQSMAAFTQCWKELVIFLGKETVFKNEEYDSSLFKLFGQFFQVNFHLYWRINEDYELQTVKGYHLLEEGESTITLILISSTSFNDRSTIRQSIEKVREFDEISSIYANWNYVILLNDGSVSTNSSSLSINDQLKLPKTEPVHTISQRRDLMAYPEVNIENQPEISEKKIQFQLQKTDIVLNISKKVVLKGTKLIAQMKDFLRELKNQSKI